MLAEAVALKHQPHWNEKIIFINGGPRSTNPTSENEIRKKIVIFLGVATQTQKKKNVESYTSLLLWSKARGFCRTHI